MKKRYIFNVLVVVFLFASLISAIYGFKRYRVYRSSAKLKDDFGLVTSQKPEYVKNEVIIKFKKTVKPIKLKENSNKDIESQNFRVDDIQDDSIPEAIKELEKKNKINKITKIFKTKIKRPEGMPNNISTDAKEDKYIDRERTFLITFDNLNIQNLAGLNLDLNEVEYIEPNYIFSLQITPTPIPDIAPNDPMYLDPNPPSAGRSLPIGEGGWNPDQDYLWGLKRINPTHAWGQTTGSANLVISVVDTGVDYNHPELAGRVVNGYDFVNDDEDSMDDHFHGTHVAGIIAASGNNSAGITGVNWNSKILAVKVCDLLGCPISAIVSGMDYSRNVGAKVINASLGAAFYTQSMFDIVKSVTDDGLIVVAAAGNDNADSRLYQPAGIRQSISVGSSNPEDGKSNFSNHTGIDVLAPGGGDRLLDGGYANILSTASNAVVAATGSRTDSLVEGNYLRLAGTSMAAPFVTGIVSILASVRPNITTEEVRAILRSTTQKVEFPTWSFDKGYGIVDLSRALEKVDSNLMARIIYPSRSTIERKTGVDFEFIINGRSVDKWILEYGIGNNPSEWQIATQGISTSTAPQNYAFDSSNLNLSTYSFRLTSRDINNNILAEDRIVVSMRPKIKWAFSSPGGRSFSNIPVVSDLDGDGTKELVTIEEDGGIIVINSDGTLQGILGKEYYYYVYSGGVAVSDLLPEVPGKEILVISQNSGLYSGLPMLRIFSSSTMSEITTDFWPVELKTSVNPKQKKYLPQVQDIDGDGVNEVLAIDVNNLFLFKNTGEKYSTLWPKTYSDFMVEASVGKLIYSPYHELQIVSITNSGKVFVYKPEGDVLSKFEIQKNNDEYTPSMILVDVDDDGLQEIVLQYIAPEGDWISGTQYISAYKPNGQMVWQKQIPPQGFNFNYPVPAATDLNGDGSQEVIAVHEEGISIFSGSNGDKLKDWPDYYKNVVLNPVTADNDGDGQMEIYYTQSSPPGIGGLSNKGEIFNVPHTENVILEGPIVEDLDADGKLEMVVQSTYASPIVVYDLESMNPSENSRIGWSHFYFNEKRTNNLGACLPLTCDLSQDGFIDSGDAVFMQECFGKTDPLGSCRTVDQSGNTGSNDVCNGVIDITDITYVSDQCPDIFSEVTPTPSALVPGDANGDGKVNGADFIIWFNHYREETTQGPSVGDFNSDGFVNGADFISWFNNYKKY